MFVALLSIIGITAYSGDLDGLLKERFPETHVAAKDLGSRYVAAVLREEDKSRLPALISRTLRADWRHEGQQSLLVRPAESERALEREELDLDLAAVAREQERIRASFLDLEDEGKVDLFLEKQLALLPIQESEQSTLLNYVAAGFATSKELLQVARDAPRTVRCYSSLPGVGQPLPKDAQRIAGAYLARMGDIRWRGLVQRRRQPNPNYFNHGTGDIDRMPNGIVVTTTRYWTELIVQVTSVDDQGWKVETAVQRVPIVAGLDVKLSTEVEQQLNRREFKIGDELKRLQSVVGRAVYRIPSGWLREKDPLATLALDLAENLHEATGKGVLVVPDERWLLLARSLRPQPVLRSIEFLTQRVGAVLEEQDGFIVLRAKQLSERGDVTMPRHLTHAHLDKHMRESEELQDYLRWARQLGRASQSKLFFRRLMLSEGGEMLWSVPMTSEETLLSSLDDAQWNRLDSSLAVSSLSSTQKLHLQHLMNDWMVPRVKSPYTVPPNAMNRLQLKVARRESLAFGYMDQEGDRVGVSSSAFGPSELALTLKENNPVDPEADLSQTMFYGEMTSWSLELTDPLAEYTMSVPLADAVKWEAKPLPIGKMPEQFRNAILAELKK